DRIDAEAVAAACQLMSDYFLPMAARVFGDAVLPKGARRATALARWIATERPERVVVRDLQRGGGGFRSQLSADEMHDACRHLIDVWWLLPRPKADRGGRPREEYPVNPRVYEALDACLGADTRGNSEGH